MPRVNQIILVMGTALALSGCLAAPATRYTPPPWTGELPEACPEAHAELRDVPILYGLIVPTGELQQQVDAGEVILGGCIVGPDKSALVCQVCGYTWRSGWWSKRANDPDRFDPPLHSVIREFPVPVAEEVNYFRLITPHRIEEGLNVRLRTDPDLAHDRILSDHLVESGARELVELNDTHSAGHNVQRMDGSITLQGRFDQWELHADVAVAPAITYILVLLSEQDPPEPDTAPEGKLKGTGPFSSPPL